MIKKKQLKKVKIVKKLFKPVNNNNNELLQNKDLINIKDDKVKLKNISKRLLKLQKEAKLIEEHDMLLDKEIKKVSDARIKFEETCDKEKLTSEQKKRINLFLVWETDLIVEKKKLEIRREANQEFLEIEEEKNDIIKKKIEISNDEDEFLKNQKNFDPKDFLNEQLKQALAQEEQDNLNILKNTRFFMAKSKFPEIAIAAQVNKMQDFHRNNVEKIKETYAKKIQQYENKELSKESIFKEYFIDKKNQLYAIKENEPESPSISELKYRELQQQKLEEAKLFKEKKREQEKWKLFKKELLRLYYTKIPFRNAMNYFDAFFGKLAGERLFSVIRERDISFLHIPLEEQKSFMIRMKYEHRESLLYTIYEIFKAYFEGQESIKILANSLFLSLLRLLYIKDFISHCVYFDDETFEVFFTKPRDPYIKNKLVFHSVLWVSELDCPFYCSYEDLKNIFYDKKYFFTFGLVLTEIGFRSVLDCIQKKIGGELILLIVLINKPISNV